MSVGRYSPAAAILALIFLGTGCASLGGLDLSAYPAKTRSLFLFNFTNNTFQPDVNRELTDWVRAEFDRRGNFKLTSKQADARLQVYGRIVVYRKEGRLFDNFRRPTRSELIVVCRVAIRQNPARIDSPPNSPLLETREVSASVDFSELQGFRESEFQARARLLRLLASRVNNAVERAYKAHFPAPRPTPTPDQARGKTDPKPAAEPAKKNPVKE